MFASWICTEIDNSLGWRENESILVPYLPSCILLPIIYKLNYQSGRHISTKVIWNWTWIESIFYKYCFSILDSWFSHLSHVFLVCECWVCVCLWRPREDTGYPDITLPYFPEMGIRKLVSSKPQPSSCFHLTAWGLQAHMAISWIWPGCWDPRSGPHICTASALTSWASL